jgi:hypothetical protein
MNLEENDQLWLPRIGKPTMEDYETKIDPWSEDPQEDRRRELNQDLTVVMDTNGHQIIAQESARRGLGHLNNQS